MKEGSNLPVFQGEMSGIDVSGVRRAFKERTPSGMVVKHCIGNRIVTKSGLGLQGI